MLYILQINFYLTLSLTTRLSQSKPVVTLTLTLTMTDVGNVVAVQLGPIPNPCNDETAVRSSKITIANGSNSDFLPVSTTDNVTRFSEIDAAEGCLGRFPGSQVMPLLQKFAGVV